MHTLFLTNTFSKEKERFVPLHQKQVTMYVCGITPYDYAHVGHGRVYVCFDLLYRLLRFLGLNPKYVRNVTDIDDKLLHKAAAVFGDKMRYPELAEKFMADFHIQTKKLNCLAPDVEPRATEYISEMIAMIQTLIQKEHAYVVGSDVYFRVSSFPEYGKLSHKKVCDLSAGIRVELNEKKEHPADFALWKGAADGEFWKSPWGYGRPGWHIECSVMSLANLGETIDIHGGGIDLIFPHHENEIAQSEATTAKPFTNYFLHNEFVNLNHEKMSKSIGNVITLGQALIKTNPMVWRFYILQHHYRMPIDFTEEGLSGAKVAYQKLVHLTSAPTLSSQELLKISAENTIVYSLISALCDDLNSPKFFGILFEHLSMIKQDKGIGGAVKTILQTILGLDLEPLEIPATEEITKLLQDRDAARKKKDWKRADEIRDQLKQCGYEVNDKKVN